jgi:hypothetical protein
MATADSRNKASILRTGIRGLAIPQGGMRPASLEYLKSGGKVFGGGVRVAVDPDGSRRIIDGRHRISLAREAGQKTMKIQVIGMGPRGGERWTINRKIKI